MNPLRDHPIRAAHAVSGYSGVNVKTAYYVRGSDYGKGKTTDSWTP